MGQFCGLPTPPAPHAQSNLTVDKKLSWAWRQEGQESCKLQAVEQDRQVEVPGYEY